MISSKKTKTKSFFKRFKNEFKAYSLISFPMIWWGVFFVFALATAIYFSFSNLGHNIEAISEFGLNNYLRILNFSKWNTPEFDTQFWKSLGISCIWTFFTMLGSNIMGLLMSFFINKIKRGKKLFLAMLFWPSLTSAVVGASLTLMVFGSGSSALANKLIALFGAAPKDWFSDSKWALPMLMVMPVFLGFSGKMIIYYAAILSVPDSLYEAAKLETKSDFLIFWHITLPMIKNAIMINVTLSLIEGLRVLGPMQLVTEGGPDNTTRSVMLHIYNLAFGIGQPHRMGRASAYSLVLFVIILILTLIQQKLFKNKEEGSVYGE